MPRVRVSWPAQAFIVAWSQKQLRPVLDRATEVQGSGPVFWPAVRAASSCWANTSNRRPTAHRVVPSGSHFSDSQAAKMATNPAELRYAHRICKAAGSTAMNLQASPRVFLGTRMTHSISFMQEGMAGLGRVPSSPTLFCKSAFLPPKFSLAFPVPSSPPRLHGLGTRPAAGWVSNELPGLCCERRTSRRPGLSAADFAPSVDCVTRAAGVAAGVTQ